MRRSKPNPWRMTFNYFDKLHTDYGTSSITEYDSKDEAVTAARNASQNHNGGGIVVTSARAYPTSGWFRRWRTEVFNFPSRYNPTEG